MKPAASENENSTSPFWILLVIHAVAGIAWMAMLMLLVARFQPLLERLEQMGELPALTSLVMLASRCWHWLLPSGLILDATILYVLNQLPGKRRWRLVVAWFVLVLVGILALFVLTFAGLILPVQKMSHSI